MARLQSSAGFSCLGESYFLSSTNRTTMRSMVSNIASLGKFWRIGARLPRFEAKAPGELIDTRIHRKGAADPPLAGSA